MALEDLSRGKKEALKKMIFTETKAGKNLRQVARKALKNFNVKLYR